MGSSAFYHSFGAENVFCNVSPSIGATCISATVAMSESVQLVLARRRPSRCVQLALTGSPLQMLIFNLHLLVIICPSWSYNANVS